MSMNRKGERKMMRKRNEKKEGKVEKRKMRRRN